MLVERICEGLSYDLAFSCDRKHIDVKLCDHDLEAKRAEGVDGVLYVLCLRIIEPPVCLNADSVDSDAFRLELLYHGHDAVHMGRSPYIEVVVIEFSVRSIPVGEYECIPYDFISVAVESLHPALVAVFSELSDDLVDNVPCVDPACISAGYCLYMGPHGLYELLAALRGAVGILPIEGRGLVVPYERVSEHPHVVLFAELNVFVRFFECPYARPRLYSLWLQAVLRRNCIEMREKQFVRLLKSSACV